MKLPEGPGCRRESAEIVPAEIRGMSQVVPRRVSIQDQLIDEGDLRALSPPAPIMTVPRSPYLSFKSAKSSILRAFAATWKPDSNAASANALPSPRELPVMGQTWDMIPPDAAPLSCGMSCSTSKRSSRPPSLRSSSREPLRSRGRVHSPAHLRQAGRALHHLRRRHSRGSSRNTVFLPLRWARRPLPTIDLH